MYSTNNTKNVLKLFLVVIVISSFSILLFVIDQESPLGHIIAQGGNITNASVNQTAYTNLWSVIFGEFDEYTAISEFELMAGVIEQQNFTSYGYDPSMVVIASSSTLNLSDILQAPPTSIDTYLGVGPTYPESGSNTFDTLYNISIGNSTHELYGAQTISINGTYVTAAFLSSGNLHFVTTTQNGTSFNNTPAFFQMFLPVNVSQNYTFTVVSNVTCPNDFFINATLGTDNESVELDWSSISGALKYEVYYENQTNASNYLEFSHQNSLNTTANTYSEIPSNNERFYKLDAYLPVYKCTSNNRAGMYRLNLTPSANLISFPFDFVNNSVSNVLAPIMDSFNSLNEYNNSGQIYNFYIQFMGSIFSNFDTVNIGKGYWLTINETVNLTIVGSLNESLYEPVYNYSNLVGFPFIQGNNSVPYVLRSINGNYSTVNEYNNTAKTYNFYIIFGGSVFSNFDTISPTLGYWILVNETQQNITLP